MRFFRRGNDDGPKSDQQRSKPDPYEVYLGLRNIPLGKQGGPTAPFEGTQIISVILDWGQANGAATIAAMADGATSLYTSSGGGVIGAGFHAPVREAHRRLMQAAQVHLGEFAPATEAPIPAKDRLAIVIRTADGLRRTEVAYTDLKGSKAPGQAVFDAANDVMTALRVVTEAQERART